MSTVIPKEGFESAIRELRQELSHLRTGRATPALVEDLPVSYYGARTPLKQLASISTPDVKSIVIQPWDTTALKDIEKAVNESSLNLHPVNEGKILRIVIPALTEERRNDLAKIVSKKIEESKIRIRTVRESIVKVLHTQKEEGSLPEDEFFRVQKELQKVVDEYNAEARSIGDKKEQEILTT
ncbi:MAG: ribosome recycling factor [Patescibacteria group bacterium]|jgi:ribosome recycling factor